MRSVNTQKLSTGQFLLGKHGTVMGLRFTPGPSWSLSGPARTLMGPYRLGRVPIEVPFGTNAIPIVTPRLELEQRETHSLELNCSLI